MEILTRVADAIVSDRDSSECACTVVHGAPAMKFPEYVVPASATQ